METLIILDTQLLVLLTVGLTGKEIIKKHKKLTEFSVDDFDLLVTLLEAGGDLLLLPNIVSEAANFLRYHKEPERGRIMSTFKGLIDRYSERYISSKAAALRAEYSRLGIADCAILICGDDRCEILTADFDLYMAAIGQEVQATNFNHRREEFGLV